MFRIAETLVSAICRCGDNPNRDLLVTPGGNPKYAERMAVDNNNLRGPNNPRRNISTQVSLKKILIRMLANSRLGHYCVAKPMQLNPF